MADPNSATAPVGGTPAATAPTPAAAGTNAPTNNAASPPGAPAQRSQADLEKLVAPIALYPDQLIATILPASVYPLEIVQAARFVKDTNNLAKLDAQPWDDNVKAVARISQVITQLDANLSWTSDLGDSFVNQPKQLMEAIQTMRGKAQQSGALQTTAQQTVVVTNVITTNTVESQVVYVTNQVVEIQPSQPNVVYVPQYNPTVVYAGYPAAYPGYYYPPYAAAATASLVSFGVGMAWGAALANNCDWGHGHVDVDVNHNYNRDVNRDVNRNTQRTSNRTGQGGRQEWKPDQARRQTSGGARGTASTREARGYGSGTAGTGARASSAGTGTRASAANAGAARSPAGAGAGASRAGAGAARTPSGAGAGAGASRAGTGAGTSAFSKAGGASSARAASARGAASRSGGFQGGGARGGGRGGRR